MKQRTLALSIILILFCSGTSFGFMESRLQWWEARLGKLTDEKALLEKDPSADPRIRDLLGREIERARGVILVFESDRRNDGSLTHQSRAIAGTDIAKEADRIVPPLCALKQLELLVDDGGSIEEARAAVKVRLAAMMTAALPRDGAETDRVAEAFMKEDIRPDDWKSIATELRLGRVMEQGPRFREECRKATVDAVTAAMAAGNNRANDRELRLLVTRSALDVVNSRLIQSTDGDSAVLDSAHSWKKIESRVEKKLSSVSSSKHIEGGEIATYYRYRARRDREYLRHLADLVSECSGLSDVPDANCAKRFAIAYDRTGAILSFAGSMPSPEASLQPFLSRQDSLLIRELSAELSAAARIFRGEMRASRDRLSRKTAAVAGGEKTAREGLNEKITQEEIDAIYRYAEECVTLHEDYRYATVALEQYSDFFDELLGQARSGAASPALEQAVRTLSLFPSLPGFDLSRLRSEYDSKRYLRTEASTALSRITALVRFYRKRGVIVRDVPAPEEISSLELRMRTASRIRIDAWFMNETNFMEIDRNAARKLALVLNRSAQGRKKTGPAGGKPGSKNDTLVTLGEPGLSLSIPGGWVELQVGEMDLYQGIVKSYHNSDCMSSIQVIKLPLENRDAKETAEEWIQKGGGIPVEKQWHRANDLDLLLILSHDKKKNIFETCALSRDGYAVLITGTTVRERYRLFKAQFLKIINSVQAGRM